MYMQTRPKTGLTARFLCFALIVAMALTAAGCSGGSGKEETPAPGPVIQTDGETLGAGNTAFPLTVVDGDGGEIHAEIRTDRETVGEALKELDVIAGEEGAAGLYVKAVNGITADYDADGVYWAFYINDAYAQTGVDSTPITAGDSYTLKVEKG